MIYLYVAAAIAFAGMGIALKVEHSGKLTAQAQVAERDAKIEAQNEAVKVTKADGDRRVAEASKGVKAATQATAKARNEAERLRVASRAPTMPGACPAGDAVADIRAGLKP